MSSGFDRRLALLQGARSDQDDAQDNRTTAQDLRDYVSRLLVALDFEVTQLRDVLCVRGGKYRDCESDESQQGENCAEPCDRFHRASMPPYRSPERRDSKSGDPVDNAKDLQHPDEQDHEDNHVDQALYAGRHRDIGVDQPHHEAGDHENQNQVDESHWSYSSEVPMRVEPSTIVLN